MTTPRDIATHGHLEVTGHQLIKAKTIFPGVRGRLTRDLPTIDGVILKHGTHVIIQPTNKDRTEEIPEFIITPYKQNKETVKANQPESHRDIITEKSYRAKIRVPANYLKFNNEHYRRSVENLFPHEDSPSLEEIVQCRTPNCFYLAAIQAILSHPQGKSFIRGMMQQNADGTTTVRLFDPQTLQAEYIRVENSVMVDKFGQLNPHEALWVHILEKAFAARGKSDLTQTNASMASVYSEGGATQLALQSLTGLRVDYFYVVPPALLIEPFLGKINYEWAESIFSNPEFRKRPKTTERNLICILQSLDENLQKNICELFDANVNDEHSKTAAFTQYVKLIKFYYTDKDLYSNALKNRSSKALAKKHPKIARMFAKIFAEKPSLSTKYNQKQLTAYNNIKTALAEGKLITASTREKFANEVIGLSDKHAFTVLGISEKKLHVKNGQETTIKARFIKLRNPWGNLQGLMNDLRQITTEGVSREYEQHPVNLDIRVKKSDEAIFYVELSDFYRYFAHYDITSSANNLFIQEDEKEKCIQELNNFVTDFPITSTTSHQELMNANQKYQQLFSKLLNLELLTLNHLSKKQIETVNNIFAEKCHSDLEKIHILGLINVKLFPTSIGTEEDIKQHVYALLKLNWLRSQPEQDAQLEAELIDTIQQYGRHEIWESLLAQKAIINIEAGGRMNQYWDDIDYLLGLSNRIEDDLTTLAAVISSEKLPSLQDVDAMMKQLLINFIDLEKLYTELQHMDEMVKKFGYITNNDEHLAQVKTVIEKCKNSIEPIKEMQTLLPEWWQLRENILEKATDMEQQQEISPTEKEEIKKATQSLFTGKLESTANKFLASSSEKKQTLGVELVKANSLATKIKQQLAKIRSFFFKASTCISTFFHFKNSYELLPMEKSNAKQVITATHFSKMR